VYVLFPATNVFLVHLTDLDFAFDQFPHIGAYFVATPADQDAFACCCAADLIALFFEPEE
jgi:hypothetical protein